MDEAPRSRSVRSQLSPQQLLTTLRAASEETSAIGEETVRGVETVHYRLDVDCEKEQFFDCEGTSPAEVWIDEEGLVRRVWIDGATIEFLDFGTEVEIEAPPVEEVVDLDSLVGEKECVPAFGEPVGLDGARVAIGKQGFTLDDPICTGNLASFGNAGATAGAFSREGQLFCFVRASPPQGAPTSARRRGTDGRRCRALARTTSRARCSPTAPREKRRSIGWRPPSPSSSARSARRIAP